MARYISKYSNFKKTVLKGTTALVSTPNGPVQQITQAPIIAYFRQAGVTNWEKEQALRHFNYVQEIHSEDPDHASYRVNRVVAGQADGEDITKRFSYYDTDEQANLNLDWTPEIKRKVEELLDRGVGPDYFRSEKPKMTAPWPAYDTLVPHGQRKIEHVSQKIIETMVEIGADPEYVLQYERENLRREPVIAAIEKHIGQTAAPAEEIVAA